MNYVPDLQQEYVSQHQYSVRSDWTYTHAFLDYNTVNCDGHPAISILIVRRCIVILHVPDKDHQQNL
jgi:hypothetical protein